ncbi:MAG TPA: 23S rRNA (guanosine(2251)-2'-O)-methyltransferase RlmB [Gammaproteobacteria bacterium]|nr:23S rRNA (guanosine(2251)-2'-O)-methyltransferase RlmB [Gammaproteobacteria bacterium]
MSDIACGVHAVRLALENGQVRRLWLDRRRRDRRIAELRELAQRRGVAVGETESDELDRLAEGVRHQGVVAEIAGVAPRTENQFEAWLAAARDPLVLVLDGVEDPRNLGACLRAADGAGVDAVVLPRRRAAGLTPAARKTAAGAAEALAIFTVTNLARTLDTMGESGVHRVGAALASDAVAPWEIHLGGSLALVLGAEEAGLRRGTRERLDAVIALPMRGVVESLNVAVACGALLYEALRQRDRSRR